ncbi:MAG: hypothetical protein JW967_06405 [Dehalococcoidales bacterium]|nr:hypothetical protein [Dehalococcoidales bacterium]
MNNKIKNSILSILSFILAASVLLLPGATIAAADTTPPAVSTNEASVITINSAILNGTLTSLGTATTVNVYFEYGTTTSYGNSTSAVAKTYTGAYSAKLNGISPGVTYHYRARVDGGVNGIAYGEDRTFRTLTIAPVVSTSLATEIVGNGAQLNGYFDSFGTATSVYVYFEYGQTTDYGSTTKKINKKETGSYFIQITGLTPDTTYHFRAVADGGTHGKSTGADYSFKTPVAVPPVVSTLAAKGVTNTSVILVGNVSALGSADSIMVSFEYGTTTDYGLTSKPPIPITVADFSNPFEFHGGFETKEDDIDDLIPGTTYHYRAKADGGVNGVSYGEDFSFKTTGIQPITPPTVDTLAASNITTGSATLNGELVLTGTAATINVYFEYGLTTSYGSSSTAQKLTKTGSFSAELTGLLSGTTYHYRTKADGGTNGVSVGPDMTFTTAYISPSIDTSEVSLITANTATLNGNLVTTGTATSIRVFFEYGTSENYGITTSIKTLTAPGTYYVNLTGLKPGTEYHVRAKADGGSNGTGEGSDITFTTLGPASISLVPDSVIQISPAEAVTGESIALSVTVENTGGATGTFAVVLKINGLIDSSQDVTIPAGATQNVSFNVVKNLAGTYQVDINGLTSSFVITSPTTNVTTTTQIPTTTTTIIESKNTQILAIGAGAAVVIGLLIYLLMRRRA